MITWDTPFSELHLPEAVNVKLDGDLVTVLTVTWHEGDYDGSKPGNYTTYGNLVLIPGVENPHCFKATVYVTVSETGVAPQSFVRGSDIELSKSRSYRLFAIPRHDSLMARARRCDRCDSLVSRPQREVRSRHINQLQLSGLNRLSCYRRDRRNYIVNMTSARPGHHNRILLAM